MPPTWARSDRDCAGIERECKIAGNSENTYFESKESRFLRNEESGNFVQFPQVHIRAEMSGERVKIDFSQIAEKWTCL